LNFHETFEGNGGYMAGPDKYMIHELSHVITTYNIVVLSTPEGKISLGRPRRRWVDNVKIDLREIVWGGSIWLRIGTSVGLL
jgi:hypothetical protein